MINKNFKPYLRDGIDVYVENKKNVVFVFLSTRKRIQLKCQSELIKLIPHMDGNNNIDDLLSISKLNEKNIVDFLNYLFEANIIHNKFWIDELPFEKSYTERIKKQLFFLMDILPTTNEVIKVQKKIKESNIAIFGVGSVGSWLLVELLSMGFEKFKIYDYKNTTASDLSRHAYYSPSNVGRSKVDTYCKIAKQISKTSQVEGYKLALNTDTDLSKHLKDIDIIINCADEPYVGYTSIYLSRYCVLNNKLLYVAGGFDAHLACLGEMIIPQETPCSDCYNSYFKESLKNWKPIKHAVKDRENAMGGLVSLNVFSASSAALSILRYLLNPMDFAKNAGGRGEFKFQDYSIDSFVVERNPKCEVCGAK